MVDIDYEGEVPGGSDEKEEESKTEEKSVMATPAVKKLAKSLNVDLTTVTGTGANGRITKEDVQNATGSKDAPVSESSSESKKAVLATPKTRGYAKEKGVDLSQVTGSGPDGRITESDIDAFLSVPAATPAPAVSSTPSAAIPELKPVDLSGLSAPVVKKLSPIQKAMVASMNQANQVPHFGYSEEYDMSALVKIRSQIKDQVMKETGVKISYMPFIIKALSLALHEFPMLNASLNSEQTEVTYHPRHNIGFATEIMKNIQNRTDLFINL